MENLHVSLWRWTGGLLFAGGIIFWIGAFTPPYKQWMTSEVREYLSIIAANRLNWYFINGCFVIGVLVTLFGMQLFSIALQNAGERVFSQLGFLSFCFGSIFWMLNLAFRLTITVWAAQNLVGSDQLYEAFPSWMQWSNLIFSFYMVLAYLSVGFMGYALLNVNVLPLWVSWGSLIFGIAGSVLYIVRFPLFAPPLMVHLPLMVAGLMMLLKIKSD